MNKQIEDEGLTCAYLLGKSDGYQQGRADAIKEYHDKLSKEMHDLWRFYKADTNNRPKPNFMCAYSMVDLIAEQLKEQKNE